MTQILKHWWSLLLVGMCPEGVSTLLGGACAVPTGRQPVSQEHPGSWGLEGQLGKVKLILIHLMCCELGMGDQLWLCNCQLFCDRNNLSCMWAWDSGGMEDYILFFTSCSLLLKLQKVWGKWPGWDVQTSCLQSHLGTAGAALGLHRFSFKSPNLLGDFGPLMSLHLFPCQQNGVTWSNFTELFLDAKECV